MPEYRIRSKRSCLLCNACSDLCAFNLGISFHSCPIWLLIEADQLELEFHIFIVWDTLRQFRNSGSSACETEQLLAKALCTLQAFQRSQTHHRPVGTPAVGIFWRSSDNGHLLWRHQTHSHVNCLWHSIHPRIKLQGWRLAVHAPRIQEYLHNARLVNEKEDTWPLSKPLSHMGIKPAPSSWMWITGPTTAQENQGFGLQA